MSSSSEDAVQVDRLSTQYCFSKPAVESLLSLYGSRTAMVLDALKKPSSRFFLRANTLRKDVETILERLEARGLEVGQDPNIPEALSIDVEGPFELPEVSKRIVADRIAAESVIQGADLYAPGVLSCRGVLRNDLLAIVDTLGHPVAVGRAQMSEREILTLRSGIAVKTSVSKYKVPSVRLFSEYADGLVHAQSLPAILTSRILSPQPNETIIDFCSSPGGKLTHIAQLMQNQGHLVAVDRNPKKMRRIRANLTRLGVRNVRLMQEDSRYLDLKYPSLEADRVILDPPCSALGLRPRLYCKIRQSELSSFPEYQVQFFKSAVRLLKDGGTVLYSTCTLPVSENEQLIDKIVEKHNLELLEQHLFLGSKGMLEFASSGAVQRFHPDIHDTCGFFIALLGKTR